MYRTLLMALACIFLTQTLNAQSTPSELIRSINHQLAEITTDNEFEKNIVYEVSLINREKLKITKSWTNNQGKRQDAHFAFSLRDLTEVQWKWQNKTTCLLLLKCRENSVERPWMGEVILGNEAEVHCLNADSEQMHQLVFEIEQLKERAIESLYAQVINSH